MDKKRRELIVGSGAVLTTSIASSWSMPALAALREEDRPFTSRTIDPISHVVPPERTKQEILAGLKKMMAEEDIEPGTARQKTVTIKKEYHHRINSGIAPQVAIVEGKRRSEPSSKCCGLVTSENSKDLSTCLVHGAVQRTIDCLATDSIGVGAITRDLRHPLYKHLYIFPQRIINGNVNENDAYVLYETPSGVEVMIESYKRSNRRYAQVVINAKNADLFKGTMATDKLPLDRTDPYYRVHWKNVTSVK